MNKKDGLWDYLEFIVNWVKWDLEEREKLFIF